jgi:hypothetical protein
VRLSARARLTDDLLAKLEALLLVAGAARARTCAARNGEHERLEVVLLF